MPPARVVFYCPHCSKVNGRPVAHDCGDRKFVNIQFSQFFNRVFVQLTILHFSLKCGIIKTVKREEKELLGAERCNGQARMKRH